MEGSVWLLASDTTQGPSVIGWGWAALNKTQNTIFPWLLDKQVLLCTVLLAQGCSAPPRFLGLLQNWPECSGDSSERPRDLSSETE